MPLADSLERDPADSSVDYLAADRAGSPVLIQRGGARTRFENVTPLDGRGFVIPFGPRDYANIERFANEINGAFLPRPQRELPAIATGNRHPEVSLPAAFRAFAEILAARGINAASTVQLSATREMTTDDAIAARTGDDPVAAGHTRVSIRHLYHAGLWAAIRAGYRTGYTAEADHIIIAGRTDAELAQSLERGKEAIHHAAGYTKFTTDTSHVFNLSPNPADFDREFSADERKWLLAEFTKPVETESRRYKLSEDDVRRLAVKFGRSLKLNEDLYDAIRREKRGADFDFEPSLDEAETLTTAEEMIFYARWLALRGRPAQLFPPNLGFKKRQAYPETEEALATYAAGKMWPELRPRVAKEFSGKPLAELEARVRELAAVARAFGATLSVHSGSGKQPAVLNSIREATGGRVNYKISGELQLQLFDVLREQPENSPWRQLYGRMVEQCEKFAAASAFGKESELAPAQRAQRGSYLGD
ncbi:MAG TPA: tagaturonate epimerase family protein, partial [Candidatus Binatia bacterium]|nr:tagaturonate epimerase family protein [Candidatus Binatia bacterium]